jgi:hypothetical protein
MLCLSYAHKLQRRSTFDLNGRLPMCSALKIVNPVCSMSVLLRCTEVTHVELYFHFKRICLLTFMILSRQTCCDHLNLQVTHTPYVVRCGHLNALYTNVEA